MAAQKLASMFELQFPQSVAVYDTYEDAQRAVDHLADNRFAVENLCIVGTDLKRVERVLGRKTWATVLGSGIVSGISTGLLVGLMLLIFVQGTNPLAIVFVGVVLGVVLSTIMSALAYAATRGTRDFNSIAQTIATRYEVLSEHKVAMQARALLAQMPGERKAAFEAGQETPAYSVDQRFDPHTGEPVPMTAPSPGQAAGPAPTGGATAAQPPSAASQQTGRDEDAWGRPSDGR